MADDDRVIDAHVVILEADVSRQTAAEVGDARLELDQARLVAVGDRHIGSATSSPPANRSGGMTQSLDGHAASSSRNRHANVNSK